MSNLRKNFWILVVCLCSFLTPYALRLTLVYAAEARSIWGKRGQTTSTIQSDNPWGIQVSPKEGYIIEYSAPKLTPLVIHVQDAHANPPSQSNISKILRQLTQKYSVKLVCVEGADGGFDDSLFNIENTDLKEKVVRYFLNEARLTGAEYEWLMHQAPGVAYSPSFTLWGIEDNNLYTDHWNVWEKTQGKQELIPLAQEILKKIQGEYGTHVSSPLLKYEQNVEAFRQGVSSLKDYLGQVMGLVNEQGIVVSRYPQVEKLLQIYQGTLSGSLSLGLSSTEELDHLEQEIRLKLASSEPEKEYVRLSRLAALFVRFVKLEMTPSEWKEYQNQRDSWEEYIHREHQINLSNLEAFRQFYELANRRDHVLLDNALSQMNNMDVERTVLIAGGFHSYGITGQLRERQLPYMVIAPKVESPTDPLVYAKAMHGKPLTVEEVQEVTERVK